MPAPEAVSLEDKYRLEDGRALMSGRQALVRLAVAQRELDRRRGYNTAGFITGYRGSPLGGVDLEMQRAAQTLEANQITFRPGLNEDLALAALAGSQQLDFVPGRKVDGVFGIWYGKGPGVDRSGDAIKHANLQGVSPKGGLLLVFGDDHTGKSSTTAHQSDLTLASWGVPVLYPSTVAEIVEMGLAGFALSRYAGSLVGLKMVNETADGTAVVVLHPASDFATPDSLPLEGDVHIRPEMVATQKQDARLLRAKLPRAAAFARANRLDRIVFGSGTPRFLIATAGKAYADVLAALALLKIDEPIARRLGIGVYKIALVFPLDPAGLEEAASQAQEIFFVEEKRPHAEAQAKDILYNRVVRPRVSGKTSPEGDTLLPSDAPIDGWTVALALADRLSAAFPLLDGDHAAFRTAVERIHERLTRPATGVSAGYRRPAFCPGCPHNTSTKVPEGSFGATGIGCHGMVVLHRERNPLPMGHMGAEGAQWIGLAPFTDTQHIFQNLGDGTYNHSGSLAIRAAVQAGVRITYKILFNDAVAMTGGQPVEGGLTVSRIVQQVRAEGVKRVVVLSEAPERFAAGERLPPDTELRHRDDLAQVQQVLRDEAGVSVLIYDQTCAAEKRRRRKIKAYPDPDQRLFINSEVCEGCGDCSVQSNCLAIQPLETELGRKRRIDQSACNKDFSCVKGFCPSFVTVAGGRPRRAAPDPRAGAAPELPEPEVPAIGAGFDLVIAGVGGTGVVTVSAILGMAARIEGFGASLYDSTGLSQKGGQVFSHVRLRAEVSEVVAARVGAEEADLVLGCDLVAAAQAEALDTIANARTRVIANSDLMATADFQLNRDLEISVTAFTERLAAAAGKEPIMLAASSLSEALLGDSIGANVLMLGYAWQQGAIPLSRAAIEQAIRINGKAVEANLRAFTAGRASAARPSDAAASESVSLDEFINRRCADLVRYWNDGYSARYADLMSAVRDAARSVEGGEDFVRAVARSAFKLMAYKDEYEVARLYSDGRFREALEREFEGVHGLKVHLSPPLLARKDPVTGRPRKIAFGAWIFPVMRALAAMRFLRESPLDIFGWSEERRCERTARDLYLQAMHGLARTLNAAGMADAVALARAPLEVRGFGGVKAPAIEALIARLRAMQS